MRARRSIPLVFVAMVCWAVVTPTHAKLIQSLAEIEVDVTPRLPDAAALGSYQGEVRIALGRVEDRGYSTGPHDVGRNMIQVVTSDTREKTVRGAVEHVLRATGLLAPSAEDADYVLDVVIRRNRSYIRQDYQRAEVFLDFSFRQGDASVGRVLAYGNAQCGKIIPVRVSSIKKQIIATYQAAFADALFKLSGSRTLAELAGEGWRPGSLSWASPNMPVGRIDRAYGYGPDVQTIHAATRLVERLDDGPPESVVLTDFTVSDEKYLKKKWAEPEKLARVVPQLVEEALGAFYPDALPEVRRVRRPPGAEESLVVSGEILRWGQTKLQADVEFSDGATGQTLFTLHFFARLAIAGEISFYTGGIWPSLIDAMRGRKIQKTGIALGPDEGAILGMFAGKGFDLEDLLAQSIAYMLVRGIRGGYDYPEDVEIQFDEVTYIDLMEASQAAASGPGR